MAFTRDNILWNYIGEAPLPLAFERTLEGAVYSKQQFIRPILDIGCGEGIFAKIVFAEKIDVGIDPNARELERARALDAYERLIECYGDRIPGDNGSFNTIFSNSVIEHIPDIEPVLREAHRLLAPGGRFYMTVPSENFERFTVLTQLLMMLGLQKQAEKYRRFFNNFWRHYHAYPLDQWKELVTRNGFVVVESFNYDPKRIAVLNDFLVPFSLVGFVMKKLTNRWTILPPLRRILLSPIYALANPYLRGGDRAERGGLVFLSLTRN